MTTDMNRRRFLSLTSMGIATMGLMGTSYKTMASNLISSQNPNLAADLDSDVTSNLMSKSSASCVTPTIATRLFASSNTGHDEVRNQKSLQRLACAGFKVDNPDIVYRQYLRFAGTDQQRISDLQNLATGAIPVPKLLLAVRGGYGAMRLLEHVDWATLGRLMHEQGSVLAGFSDVTAVQCALLAQGGMSSLSAPMLYSEFGKTQPDKVSCQRFVEAITNPKLSLNLPQQNIAGHSNTMTGILWGGNLSVVSALAGSKYLPKPKGGIVFLEDVGEQPYKIERMLYSLYLAGAFKDQQAIILGAFSGTGEDSYDARYDLSIVIEELHRITGLPIYTGLPFGHVARKQSFPLGAMCEISASDAGLSLKFSDYPTIDSDLIHPEGLWQ